MAALSAKQKASPNSPDHLRFGLSPPAALLKGLQKRGIYCAPGVSLEHQHRAKRYVLRGVESGGAVLDMGRACAFLATDGSALPWLQRIDSIAVNGRHAIFLAQSLVRIEMLRMVHTYELAISIHILSARLGHTRPEITSKLLFRGRDGSLPIDLWREEHRTLRGELVPTFHNRAGELMTAPERFDEAIRNITAAVCCIGCRHTHVGVSPTVELN
jgi:hypothetical protein